MNEDARRYDSTDPRRLCLTFCKGYWYSFNSTFLRGLGVAEFKFFRPPFTTETQIPLQKHFVDNVSGTLIESTH